MNVTITPTLLHGAVVPPPSKSQAHRLLLAAALAHGASTLSNVAFSQDIQATVRCLEALGADVRREGDCLSVTGLGGKTASGANCPGWTAGRAGPPSASLSRWPWPSGAAACSPAAAA